MKRTKKIHLKCYGPHGFDKYQYTHVPWEDIWISFHMRRKRIRICPVIVWAGEIDSQIKFQEEQNARMYAICLRKWDQTIYDESDPFCAPIPPDWFLNKNTEWMDLQWIKNYFQEHSEDFGIKTCGYNMKGGMNDYPADQNEKYPEILVNRPQLARKDIEEALEWYLRSQGYIKNVNIRFRWRNRSKVLIIPT